jgi:hypothetical protein
MEGKSIIKLIIIPQKNTPIQISVSGQKILASLIHPEFPQQKGTI